MRISIHLLRRVSAAAALLLGLAAPLAGQSGTRYTTTEVRLRAAPSTESAALLTLSRGATVRVVSCADDWCRVQAGGRSGYAAERYLSGSRPAARAGSSCGDRGHVNSRGNWVPSPCRSPGGPPEGATARCRDGTYSFSQSRRGTCSGHGGVAAWL